MAFFFISFILDSMQGLLKSSSNKVKLIMLLGMLFTFLSSQANAIEVGDHLPLGQIQ